MNAVTLLAANGDVVNDIRADGSQGLHKQCRGCLSVHIEVTPDADQFFFVDGIENLFDGGFDIGERRGGKFVGMEKSPGGVGSQNPASEESLRDERRQVEGRKRRNVYVRRVKPAGHVSKYQGLDVGCQVCFLAQQTLIIK